jgi:hypothetical protein
LPGPTSDVEDAVVGLDGGALHEPTMVAPDGVVEVGGVGGPLLSLVTVPGGELILVAGRDDAVVGGHMPAIV